MPVAGKSLSFQFIHGYWVIGYWEITSCIIILLLLIRDGESVGDVYQPVLPHSLSKTPAISVLRTWYMVIGKLGIGILRPLHLLLRDGESV